MLPGIKYKSLKITEDLTIDLDFISLHLNQIHLKRNFSYPLLLNLSLYFLLFYIRICALYFSKVCFESTKLNELRSKKCTPGF